MSRSGAERQREWRKNHPERREQERAYSRQYQKELRNDPERRERKLQRDREWWKHHSASQYGITEEEVQNLLLVQEFVCAICKNPETSAGRKTLSIDHDHLTGRVRGLLCLRCNAGLGNFNDSVALLKSAISYLGEN